MTRDRRGGAGGRSAGEQKRASAKGEQPAGHGATSNQQNRRAAVKVGRFRRGVGISAGCHSTTFIILTKFAPAGIGPSRKKMRISRLPQEPNSAVIFGRE